MQLTKEQLKRIFSLYEGFGWQPGMLPPEITTVEDDRTGQTIAVRLGGYSIYVDHMGRVLPPPAPADRGEVGRPSAEIGIQERGR
jgi:hypothetical protein